MKKIYIEGNDNKSKYLRQMYNDSIAITRELAEIIVVPVPFSKDLVTVNIDDEITIEQYLLKIKNKTVLGGPINQEILNMFTILNIEYIDMYKQDALAIKNAIPTAEGAIVKAIKETDITIQNAKVCVIGFGRCGKILCDKLYGMKANVYCAARKKKDLALINSLGYNSLEISALNNELNSFDIIFSTVPAMILDEEKLSLIRDDTVIIDIASKPGSVDYEAASKLGKKAFLELGIPSKVAPKSAAMFLKEAIDEYII